MASTAVLLRELNTAGGDISKSSDTCLCHSRLDRESRGDGVDWIPGQARNDMI
ncbi:MAG: hypothetical protein HOC20_08905 [Chloroflexi bacterium]|jgi:hypothetical protein|nr:hypothetical protein [Chloroflexota bacterium]